MSYQINLGQWNSVFAVPCSLVDRHIKLASEAQLKVLLYLLRHTDDAPDDNRLCEALRLSKEEAHNAVQFWIERGLLTEDGGSLIPAGEIDSSAPSAEQIEPSALSQKAVKKPHTAVSRAQRPDPLFVSKLLKENALLAGLMEQAQITLKKPLSPGDTATLVMLYDSFGLPCAVIALLLTHLASVGNANMRAVERCGIRWADEGINTVEAAEREIERLNSSREAWGKVSRLLGIRSIGNPTQAQMENAHRWLVTWNFSDEMITEAYERCVNTRGEYSISYINAILKRWYEKDIKSLDTLKSVEASRKKPSKSVSKRGKGSVFSVEGASFDVKKYEEQSMFDD